MVRMAAAVVLAGCGVSEGRVQQLIEEADGGGAGTTAPPGGVTQEALDQLRAELEAYADAAAAAAADGVAPPDAGDLTGTLDPEVLPELPVDVLPLRTRTVSLPVTAVYVEGGAFVTGGAFGNAGIVLPSEGSFAHSFVVPPDYDPVYPLLLNVVWRASTAECAFGLRANFLDVARVGATPYGGNAIGGLQDPPLLISPATPLEAVETTFEVLDANGNGLRPRDAVNVGFYRLTSEGDCRWVSVAGLYLEYVAR